MAMLVHNLNQRDAHAKTHQNCRHHLFLELLCAFIDGLYKAGINVVRLNTAHMTHEDAKEVIDNTRAVSDKIGNCLTPRGRKSEPARLTNR